MSVVYFIKPKGAQGPVKIGYSTSLERRRQAIESWSPVPLEIIAELPGGYTLEHRLQNYFAADHSHSEWFRWSPRMAQVVASIRAGTFDESILPTTVAHVGGKPRGNPQWRRRISRHDLRPDLYPREEQDAA